MLFNSLEFAVFLPIVLAVYWQLGLKNQNRFMVLASYVFYGWWDWRFLTLMLFSTVVDFAVARGMAASNDAGRRKHLLWISIATNLGILAFFKYFNFFIDSGITALAALNIQMNPIVLHVVLPVGISFYTFQTLSYTIDVYKGGKHCNDFTTFALYVCFFPQLVAGPIERASRLLPQLSEPRTLKSARFTSGLFLILVGLFRKVGIADSLAVYVDEGFNTPLEFTSLGLLARVYLFALQIYCDFSGYSSIARGTARLFGVELMRNFEQPYLSTNITEFWRRWHISLSSWLRDYLYITLGGNRGGELRTYRNLMVTMLLGGLWHGAGWNFVIWGALHGAALAIHKMWRGAQRKAAPKWDTPQDRLASLASLVLTFHLVCFAWIFFRADSFVLATQYLQSMVAGPLWVSRDGFVWQILVVYSLASVVVDVLQYRSGSHTPIESWRWPLGGLAAGLAVIWIGIMGGIDVQVPFIYFQF